MKIPPRFTGLKLPAKDRAELLKMQRSRKPQTPRRWRRIRSLLLLDRGYGIRATAAAIGGYHREITRVARRYLQGGLVKALSDEPRPKPSPMLDSTQQAALVAMVCGPPPQGRARWTVRLLAEEAGKRGVVDRVGRETVRVVLARHDLKPWRKKNVVRSRDQLGIRGPDGGRA
jgi:putative transposase